MAEACSQADMHPAQKGHSHTPEVAGWAFCWASRASRMAAHSWPDRRATVAAEAASAAFCAMSSSDWRAACPSCTAHAGVM